MAYVNSAHVYEGNVFGCEPETSQYTHLSDDTEWYCKVESDEDNEELPSVKNERARETVELPSVNVEPSNTEHRLNANNIRLPVKVDNGIEKSAEQQLAKWTYQSKLKIIMVIVGMIALVVASSTITAFLLKQVRVLICFVEIVFNTVKRAMSYDLMTYTA